MAGAQLYNIYLIYTRQLFVLAAKYYLVFKNVGITAHLQLFIINLYFVVDRDTKKVFPLSIGGMNRQHCLCPGPHINSYPVRCRFIFREIWFLRL
jgi:hypothetical protein